MDLKCVHHGECQIGGQDDKIAMGDIDETHDAEAYGKIDREHRVESAKQRALNNDRDPIHRYTPKYADRIRSRSTLCVGPVNGTRPSWKQYIRSATDNA